MILPYLLILPMVAVVYGNTQIVDPLQKGFELTNRSCQTKSIHINPVVKYQTTKFTVWYCPIKEVPASLNSLKLLTIIRFNYNEIEFVDMASFNGLDHLTELHLQHNKIAMVTSSVHINLPDINYISLYSNQITELDICKWNMPKLSQLYFNMNKLSYVTNFLHQFPNLDLTGLDGNSFNCEWQSQLLRDIGNTKIKIYPEYDISPCNPSDVSTPPSSCPVSTVPLSTNTKELLEEQLPKVEDETTNCCTKLTAMETAYEQLNEKFKEVKQAHRTQIANYETEIKQLNEKLNGNRR